MPGISSRHAAFDWLFLVLFLQSVLEAPAWGIKAKPKYFFASSGEYSWGG